MSFKCRMCFSDLGFVNLSRAVPHRSTILEEPSQNQMFQHLLYRSHEQKMNDRRAVIFHEGWFKGKVVHFCAINITWLICRNYYFKHVCQTIPPLNRPTTISCISWQCWANYCIVWTLYSWIAKELNKKTVCITYTVVQSLCFWFVFECRIPNARKLLNSPDVHFLRSPMCSTMTLKTHGLSVSTALLQRRHQSEFWEHFCGISLAF